MKAILFKRYGPPDVLEVAEVETPAPEDEQVLVKVHAASANPLDWHRMRGKPFVVRVSGGLLKPEMPRLGADVAGRVEQVGKNVTEFQVGDEVFGSVGAPMGRSYNRQSCQCPAGRSHRPQVNLFCGDRLF